MRHFLFRAGESFVGSGALGPAGIPFAKAGERAGHKYKYRKRGPKGWQYVYEKRGPKNPRQEKEHSKFEAAREHHDPGVVSDMHNLTSGVSYQSGGDLGSLVNQRVSIEKNLINKMAAGVYDHHEARKLWQYHSDNVGKTYAKRGQQVSMNDRRQMAHELADRFLKDHDSGQHDHHLQKQHQIKTKTKKPGQSFAQKFQARVKRGEDKAS